MPVQTIGLLTGFGCGGADYYRLIVEKTSQLLPPGKYAAQTPPMIVASMNFSEFITLLVESRERQDHEDLSKWLLTGVGQLQKAGAEFLVISTPPAHACYNRVRETWPGFPVLHIGDTTAVAMRSLGFKNVGVMGLEEGLKPRLQAHGITVMVPDDERRKQGIDIFCKDLALGNYTEEARAFFVGVCRRLFEEGCQAVLMGAVELEHLVQQKDVPDIPLIYPSEHHIRAAARVAAGQASVEDFAPP